MALPILIGKFGTGFEACTLYSKTIEQPPPQGFLIPQSLWLIPKKDNIPADHPLFNVDRIIVIPGVQLASDNIVPKTNDIFKRNADNSVWVAKMIEHPMQKDWRIHVIHAPTRTLGNQ